MTLRLAPAVRAALESAWREVGEAEPCGYLLGRGDAATRFLRGRNVHPRPAFAFRLAPEEQLAVRRAARVEGLEVLAVWHGHRIGAARPSRADREGHGRLAPPWMVIAGRGPDGAVSVRAYRSPAASRVTRA